MTGLRYLVLEYRIKEANWLTSGVSALGRWARPAVAAAEGGIGRLFASRMGRAFTGHLGTLGDPLMAGGAALGQRVGQTLPRAIAGRGARWLAPGLGAAGAGAGAAAASSME